MPLCSVTDLKTKSAALVSNAQKGQASIVLRNNRPVAALVPYHEHLEDVLEEIGWLMNKELHASIKKASKSKAKPISSKDFRKELGL